MASCTVCRTDFSWNPLSKHFREYTCGVCGGLVGTGCFTTSTDERGHDVIVCDACEKKPAKRKPAPDTIAGRAGSELGNQVQGALAPLIDHGLNRLSGERKALSGDLKLVGAGLLEGFETVLARQRSEALADAERRIRALLGVPEVELQLQADGSYATPGAAPLLPSLRREADIVIAKAIAEADGVADRAVAKASAELESWRQRLITEAEAAAERQRIALVQSGEAAGQRLTDRAAEVFTARADALLAQAEARIQALRQEILADAEARLAAAIAAADQTLAARWTVIAADAQGRADAAIARARDAARGLLDDGLHGLDALIERRARTELRTAAWLVLILTCGVLTAGAASLLVTVMHRWVLG